MKGRRFIEDVRDARQRMSFMSAVRWALLRRSIGAEHAELLFHVPGRFRLKLRKRGSDRHTCEEVLFKHVYQGVIEHAGALETILDLGANIGCASLYFLSAYEKVRVLAVEAAHSSCDLLERNLSPYVASGRAQVVRGAVWESDGWVTAALQNDPSQHSRFSVRECWPTYGRSGQRIRAFSMETLLEMFGRKRVDLVKIDIEGAEARLFSVSADWIERVSCLAVEFHGNARRECDFDRVIARHGLTVREEGKHTVVASRAV